MVDGEKPGVGSRDEGKHTGRNDLLFVEKMMVRAYSYTNVFFITHASKNFKMQKNVIFF